VISLISNVTSSPLNEKVKISELNVKEYVPDVKENIQPDFSDSLCFPENSEEWIHVCVGESRGSSKA
jgi:hypothetical protein